MLNTKFRALCQTTGLLAWILFQLGCEYTRASAHRIPSPNAIDAEARRLMDLEDVKGMAIALVDETAKFAWPIISFESISSPRSSTGGIHSNNPGTLKFRTSYRPTKESCVSTGIPPIKEAQSPVLGSTSAIMENAMASGISATATTVPDRRSARIFPSSLGVWWIET